MNIIDTERFKHWLQDRGCEILPCTNEYESLRFVGKEIGVLYKSGKVSNQFTAKALSCFIRNISWDGKPINVGRNPSYKKEKINILKRDGPNCFLCNLPLDDDITLDHLQPLSTGGKNTLSNMVLMHEKCNQELKNILLIDKIKLIIKNRINS